MFDGYHVNWQIDKSLYDRTGLSDSEIYYNLFNLLPYIVKKCDSDSHKFSVRIEHHINESLIILTDTYILSESYLYIYACLSDYVGGVNPINVEHDEIIQKAIQYIILNNPQP